jgi:pentatricopeptide repeat protein
MNIRVWNVLLGALAEGAKLNDSVLEIESCALRKGIDSRGAENAKAMSTTVDGMSCTEAVLVILDVMRSKSDAILTPAPNSQSYCIAASALQYCSSDGEVAMELFQNATVVEGIAADGRFINAVFRCFGGNIDSALTCWKTVIRKACLRHESRTRKAPASIYRSKNKNLIAAYNGLLHVCGRALRPDIALRIAYAMGKEGIEPNDVSLNNYLSGKRIREQIEEQDQKSTVSKLFPKLDTISMYENLLYVECTKYDQYNKRMSKDRRVRIIV